MNCTLQARSVTVQSNISMAQICSAARTRLSDDGNRVEVRAEWPAVYTSKIL
jgi:hypothetical protein